MMSRSNLSSFLLYMDSHQLCYTYRITITDGLKRNRRNIRKWRKKKKKKKRRRWTLRMRWMTLRLLTPYEIEEGELLPPPADSDTSSDSEPEVEAEDEDGDEATVYTITRAPYSVPPFSGTIYMGSDSSRKVFAPGPIGKDVDMMHRKVKGLAQQMFDRANTEYSTLKRLGEMDRYLSGISTERRSEAREHHKLKQSVSTLEGQMRGLMLEDKEEKERLKKKLRVSQQEKDQIEQAFRHVIDWIRKQFGVKIRPCMGDDDVTTPDDVHP
nr:hypothetical protein [Tanacetum cinerariifolium]